MMHYEEVCRAILVISCTIAFVVFLIILFVEMIKSMSDRM